MDDSSRYKEAGVDIDAADDFLRRIKPLVRTTFKSHVISDIGGFGGVFSLENLAYKRPVLVASTDGVGTKLVVAFMMDKHDTIGIDLVAMNVNDIVAHGAKPLFFLDYLAMGKLNANKAEQIVSGIIMGCKTAGCSLIGGETAEMPGIYKEGEYDLAGFVVGAVERDSLIDGSEVHVGCKLIGLASSGLHANGFSLARHIFFNKMKLKPENTIKDLGIPLGEELLRPTRIYVESILNVIRSYKVLGIAHITGGGILDNLKRVLPESCKAIIAKKAWQVPPIFRVIQKMGKVSTEEMFRTFNMGIGLILVVRAEDTQEVATRLKSHGEIPCIIGEVVPRPSPSERPVELV